MIIGHHILYGKEMELDQPVVAITKPNSEGRCNFLKEMIICIFLDICHKLENHLYIRNLL